MCGERLGITFFATAMCGSEDAMTKKKFKKISGVVCVSGLLITLGAAGASDLDLIPLSEIVLRCCIGMAMFVGGGTFWGIFEW